MLNLAWQFQTVLPMDSSLIQQSHTHVMQVTTNVHVLQRGK